MVKKFTILLYSAAATTLIAGSLHINKFIDTISSGEHISNPDVLFNWRNSSSIFDRTYN